MKLRCLIIDDEPIARKGLAEELAEITFLGLAGVAKNAIQANQIVAQQSIDLIFLDLDMPKMTGLEFLKVLKDSPLVIIITAYSQYAVDAFNADVIDYLVKPVSFERLLKACNKAREYFAFRHNISDKQIDASDHFFIKCENKYEKIFVSDVLFAESKDNYVAIHTPARVFISYVTLKNIEEYLTQNNFIKVHKSFIVNIDKVGSIERNSISIMGKAIPLSRHLKDDVIGRITNKKIIKRL